MTLKPHIKICCISSIAEAQMAIRAGASAIGLVGPMPSGPGVISNELIADIASQVKGKVDSFLLTSKPSSKAIIAHHLLAKTTTIQIVDQLKEGSYADLRKDLPGVRLVQVIHVLDERNIEEAVALSEEVDALLLDSGNPNLQVKELGGTGRTHNWEISRAIIEQVNVPVYLAGGLKPENVRKAIEAVRPYGVDLCSGVRTNGHLDKGKLERFVAAVRGKA